MEGRTYRYFVGTPLFPFGYGLSYSSFRYSDLNVTPHIIQPGEDVHVRATVANIGTYDADEVHVKLYIHHKEKMLPSNAAKSLKLSVDSLHISYIGKKWQLCVHWHHMTLVNYVQKSKLRSQ